MTARQQETTQFPIKRTREAFDGFVNHERRRDLWGQRERNALMCVQPFTLNEEAAEHGVSFGTSAEEEYRIHALARLSHLNNLDKHRRLPLLAWSADVVTMTGETNECTWTWLCPPHAVLRDGDLIGEATYPRDRPPPEVTAPCSQHLPKISATRKGS